MRLSRVGGPERRRRPRSRRRATSTARRRRTPSRAAPGWSRARTSRRRTTSTATCPRSGSTPGRGTPRASTPSGLTLLLVLPLLCHGGTVACHCLRLHTCTRLAARLWSKRHGCTSRLVLLTSRLSLLLGEEAAAVCVRSSLKCDDSNFCCKSHAQPCSRGALKTIARGVG